MRFFRRKLFDALVDLRQCTGDARLPGRGRGALFPCLAMAAAPDRAEIDKSVDCCGRGVSGRSGIPWGAAGIPWDFFGGCPGAWVQGSGASHRSALSGSGPADMLRAAHALAPCQPDGCSCGRLARKTRPEDSPERPVRKIRANMPRDGIPCGRGMRISSLRPSDAVRPAGPAACAARELAMEAPTSAPGHEAMGAGPSGNALRQHDRRPRQLCSS